MIKSDELRQLHAYARIDGLILGAVWVASFCCYICGLTNPAVSMIGNVLAIISPYVAYRRMRKFRDEVREGVLSFRRAMYYYTMVFVFGALIFALAQYVYFDFIDGGYLYRSYISILSTPESQALIKAYGVTTKEVDSTLEEMMKTSPISLVINIFAINTILGVVFSVPAAMIGARRVKRENNIVNVQN